MSVEVDVHEVHKADEDTRAGESASTDAERPKSPQPTEDSHDQASPHGESVGLGVRLLVSPGAGRLRHLPPAEFHEGHEWVSAGQAVALVEQGPVTLEVRSPIAGRVAGVLVRDGEPVALGQPLVWLDEAPRRTKSAGKPGDRQ
jgi:acetyl-CoA carboxylase biotin carboxyl carrier protein